MNSLPEEIPHPKQARLLRSRSHPNSLQEPCSEEVFYAQEEEPRHEQNGAEPEGEGGLIFEHALLYENLGADLR